VIIPSLSPFSTLSDCLGQASVVVGLMPPTVIEATKSYLLSPKVNENFSLTLRSLPPPSPANFFYRPIFKKLIRRVRNRPGRLALLSRPFSFDMRDTVFSVAGFQTFLSTKPLSPPRWASGRGDEVSERRHCFFPMRPCLLSSPMRAPRR